MSTVMWDTALQGVTPITGGQALPPATYRFRATGGEGKLNSNKNIMLSLVLEVASGPMQGRKAFHNENLPTGSTDTDKQRMGFFLGLLEAFGITGDMLRQMFQGQQITVESIDYLAKYVVQTGRIVKGNVRPQRNDPTRVNLGGWSADDGIEPPPPVQNAAPSAPAGPPAPGIPQGMPGMSPVGGPPVGAAPGLPLGGFPGSGSPQGIPNQAPEWAQPAAQAPAQDQGFPGQQFQGQVNPANFPAQNQQAPQQFAGPGQMAPAAQPQAAGMNQLQQPAAAQFPQAGPQGFQQPQAAPASYDQQMQAQGGQFYQQQPNGAVGLPGQQGQAPGLPGPAAQQIQAAAQPGVNTGPAGLPQGGFPPPQGAPQATF